MSLSKHHVVQLTWSPAERFSRNVALLTGADFLVRSAYQMGKTPLLPIFAATLGATGAFLGMIVAVSTLTGMVLKPLIGMLSDRWGRRGWLVLGTVCFAGMPFLYRFVHSSEALFGLRLMHGMATAIYGPVTLAFVAEQAAQRRAEYLGWFGMARQLGYIVGPAAAGGLLTFMEPVQVFTVIGLVSVLAFAPIAWLTDGATPPRRSSVPLRTYLVQSLRAGGRTPAVWLTGGLEATVYIALYAAKAFLPIYALAAGVHVALVGTFFAVQETTHLVLKPVGGRLGDRLGYVRAIGIGMAVLGCALPLLTWAQGSWSLLAVAVVLGGAQALIFPSTVALAAAQLDAQHLGAGMGFIGTLKNAGKVAGPVLGGFLMHSLGFAVMFHVMGALALLGALLVGWRTTQVWQPLAVGTDRQP